MFHLSKLITIFLKGICYGSYDSVIFLFAHVIYRLPTTHMEHVTAQLPVQMQTVQAERGGPWILIKSPCSEFIPEHTLSPHTRV